MFLVLFRTLLLACFAVWFGGFFFYTAVVVTIGTEVLGSAVDQGMITRKVTIWLNIVSAIAVLFMAIESIVSWRRSGRIAKWFLAGSTLLIGLSMGGLFYLHPILDALIDPETMEISEHDRFYQLHRIYLWLSTVQWIAGWFWLIAFVSPWPGPARLIAADESF